MDKYKKGYLKFGPYKKGSNNRAIKHLQSGMIKKIEEGDIPIIGYDDEGGVICGGADIPIRTLSMWNQSSHDAGKQGSDMLQKIFNGNRFSFPKSVYATMDAINFIVKNKPNALVIDFFAGSGTTLHAVNLLNANDGGHRRCILVTNNEMKKDEEDALLKKGVERGSDEWNAFGIARYVTWPRTVCSIKGHDVNGKALKDDYLTNATEEQEANRIIKKISYFKDFLSYGFTDQKDIIYALSDKSISKSSIEEGDVFAISDEDVSILWDVDAIDDWLGVLEDCENIHRYLIITDDSKAFRVVRTKIIEKFGKTYKKTVMKKMPMADGFKTNAAFFKLGFLDKTKVSLGMQFKELLSTLWMKAGAVGKCPVIEAGVPDMLILPENKMAILNDENRFSEFAEQLAEHPEIKVVYLVTDYENGFIAMTQALGGKVKTYQLYRDYLDNFRINAGRNGR